MQNFETIEEAKTFARERVQKDEESWHIAWDEDHRIHNGVRWVDKHVAAFSDPEKRFSEALKESGLDKTIFATIHTERDDEGNLTMTLNERMWNQIADMLDMRNKELENLTNEEIILLDELQKRGM